jgi:hypothetical protein
VAPPDPEKAWLRPTGQAWTAGGGVLLAGGAVVGLLARRMSDDLDRRYERGQLTAADHGDFGRARGLGIAANILLAAGGVATVAGGTMWLLAPDVQPVAGGATVGVQGRF